MNASVLSWQTLPSVPLWCRIQNAPRYQCFDTQNHQLPIAILSFALLPLEHVTRSPPVFWHNWSSPRGLRKSPILWAAARAPGSSEQCCCLMLLSGAVYSRGVKQDFTQQAGLWYLADYWLPGSWWLEDPACSHFTLCSEIIIWINAIFTFFPRTADQNHSC